MTAWKLRILLGAATMIAVGCTDDDPLPTDMLDAGMFPSTSEGGVDPNCIDPTSKAFKSIECSGLYEDFATKRVAPGVREFAPSTPLWSDGAEKTRWIRLPPGTKIDNSDPAEWKFPVGTQAWKEFRANGKRIETRLWQKMFDSPFGWVGTTYQWLDNETRTVMSPGGDVPLEGGGTYYIPRPEECTMCHDGHRDRLLGFEAPLLGLPNAKGITLEMLAQEGLLTNPPAKTKYEVPDDGTGMSQQLLPWIHANCGVSCHNELPNAEANGTGLWMRLHPSELEGKPLSEWNLLKNTLGVDATQGQFAGMKRIDPGYPTESLLYNLAALRGPIQMPPIATRITDPVHTELLHDWIAARGALVATPDAGAPDAGGPIVPPPVPDAGGPVAPPPDAAVADAGVVDAATDAAATDAAVLVDASSPPVVDAAVPPPLTDGAVVEPDLDGAVLPVDLEASTPVDVDGAAPDAADATPPVTPV